MSIFSPKTQAMKDAAEEMRYARAALDLMQKQHISPVPENYAVWYHYAMGRNISLIREVDKLLKNDVIFSQETCSYLHNKFILNNKVQRMADDTANNAQKVLVEVLKVIQDFNDETKSFNKGVDQYLENISQNFEDSNVKAILKELITATVDMKKRGESINQQLVESTNEINNLKKNLQQVTFEAQRDFLTGVFNRKTFEKFVDDQMEAAKTTGHDLCLLMIDIDHFKQFNDRFGHLLGDEVLKIVARTLIESLKGRDVVARFGGEEFVVTLPETNIDGAMKVAEILRSAIATKELRRKDTGEMYGSITISVGVARFRPESDSLPLLIKRADEALYESKNLGRNRVTREKE